MSIVLDKRQCLIAGDGALPVAVAKAAQENGFEMIAISLSSDNRNQLKKYCSKVYNFGPGEILKIKRYCEDKSNELNREVLVRLVSNGTLLNPLIADILQKNGILFGVSLDGNELIHDKHRKTKDGKNTYQTIIDNVNNILHHEYVGAACTLTNDVFSLKDSLIELSKTFNTVSYKPSRDCLRR